MNYVNFSQLDDQGYINTNQLSQALPTPTVLPCRLNNRIVQLEKNVHYLGGMVDLLATKLKDFIDNEQGAAVTARPYHFRDAMD